MIEQPDDNPYAAVSPGQGHAASPVAVTLPDGSRREFPHPVTGGEIAAAIGEALSLGENERAAFSRRAIAHVASRYSRQAMCARTIEVYEELLFPEESTLRQAAPAAVVA